jgi:hypothetical protein
MQTAPPTDVVARKRLQGTCPTDGGSEAGTARRLPENGDEIERLSPQLGKPLLDLFK